MINQISEEMKKPVFKLLGLIITVAGITSTIYETVRIKYINEKHEAILQQTILQCTQEKDKLKKLCKCTKNCNKINISIESLKNNDLIKNGQIVSGFTSQLPCDDTFIWALLYGRKIKKYFFAQQLVFSTINKWQIDLNLTGATLNEICDLKIVLVNNMAHSLLNDFYNKGIIPSNINICKELKLRITQ